MTAPASPTPRRDNRPTQAELDAWVEKQAAIWPPLTEQQKANLRRLMRPRPSRSA